MGTKRRDYLWYGFAALVNKALHKTDLLLDLERLAAMADRLTGAQPGLLVAVGDATPAEFPADTLLTEIVPAGKGLLADHRFYFAQQLEGMTLSGLASRSGVLRPMTDRDCPVDLTKKEMLTLRRQSCGKCLPACPKQCIEGGEGLVAVIDSFECSRCGECLTVCEQQAIKCTSGRLPSCPPPLFP